MSIDTLRGPVGAVLLMVVALAGVSVHLGVWLNAKRHADSLNTLVFEANAAVTDARAACEREQGAPAGMALAMPGDESADAIQSPAEACASMDQLTARRQAVVADRQQRREAAWAVVPPMLIWPVAGVFGLLRYVRLTRR